MKDAIADALSRAIRRFVHLVRFRARATDLENELAFHREQIARELITRGVPHADVPSEVRRRMGNETFMREEARGVWLWPTVESLWQDVRVALRGLGRSPGFTLVVTLTLALGVGANAAVFSVLSTVMLRPLPFSNPDRVVMIWERDRTTGRLFGVTPADFADWRGRTRMVSSIAALDPFPTVTLTGAGAAERLAAAAVSAELFSVLGVKPVVGRQFVASDQMHGGDHIVMLGHDVWRTRFGGDSNVVGRTITLSNTPYKVVGVLPASIGVIGKPSDYYGRTKFDVWIPLRYDPQLLPKLRGTHPLRVFARLSVNRTIADARSEMDGIATALEAIHPETNEDRGTEVVSLADQVFGSARRPLFILSGAAILVFAIACANVVALLLGRATKRTREIAVRIALGAGRRRVVRQLVTEGIVMSSIGSAAGVCVAWGLIGALRRLIPVNLPFAQNVAIDGRVLTAALVVAVATGVLFGIAPLVLSRHKEMQQALRAGARSAGTNTGGAQRVFVVGQLAFALTLLVGAGLATKSLLQLMAVDPGFKSDHVLTARISLAGDSRYETSAQAEDFFRELVERVERVPMADEVAVAAHLPLSGSDNSWGYQLEGWPKDDSQNAKYRPVGTRYFETVGIPLRSGRTFTNADRADASRVVVINESLARVITNSTGAASAIGKRVRMLDPTMEWRTVVGVVADVRHFALDQPALPELYLPLGQTPFPVHDAFLTIRTRGEPTAIVEAMRRTVAALSPDKAVFDVQTMEQRVSASAGDARFRATLLGLFAILALVIATVGVFGVMAYIVGQRTRELGIRLAIGARPVELVNHVMRDAAVTVAIGVSLGLGGAWTLGRVLASFLFNVAAFDGAIVLSVASILAASSLVAAWVPARRLIKLSPIAVLQDN